ncbi:MAG: hypothetical protein ACLP3C_14355 [Mycobacterium sp.]|uniref:hypothetical protein n=1 Tax=Mycobacterium sp. TaxID=1785 RepID=UPI003F944244
MSAIRGTDLLTTRTPLQLGSRRPQRRYTRWRVVAVHAELFVARQHLGVLPG